MAHVIAFATMRFDPAAEEPNEINPIPGQGILAWLACELAGQGWTVGQPTAEDWGWYVDAARDGVSYMVGASGSPGGHGGPHDWTVQIDRHRTLADRLLRRSRLAAEDPLSAAIEALCRAQPDFQALTIDPQ